MPFETDNWEYIPAKHQKPWTTKRDVIWLIIHSMETPETEGRARGVAKYFQNPPRIGSSHLTVDDKETIQCVRDNNEAAGAVGANKRGIHIEIPGYAKQTAAEWDDNYSRAALARAADAAAQYCLKYSIPVRKIEAADLKAGVRGICGHADVSKAFPGTGHSDPGQSFPWPAFIAAVQAAFDQRKDQHD